MSELTPIQLASRASKRAAAADKKDPHSDATKDIHGEAHGHWHHLAKSEKDDFYKSHYSTMAKHHFNRSYGKDSDMPYRVESRFNKIPGGKAARSKPSDFDPKQLAMGIEVEQEHGRNSAQAREIAMDHLKEFPDYYTRLKRMEKSAEKAKEESGMEIHHLLGLLEDVRSSFGEAASPPPFKAKERQAAGLPAMPTRKGAQPPPIPMKARKPVDPNSDVGQALGDMKKMGKEAELKKRREADAPAREKKQQAQLAVAKKRIAAGGTHLGTKGLGIKRSFSRYSVPGAKPGDRDDDVRAGVHMAAKATYARAAKGEALEGLDLLTDIRRLLEADGVRYGGGSRLNTRELAAKGMAPRNAVKRRKAMPRIG